MSESNIEGVYPLSPQQLGMLLDSLREPRAGVHIEQAVHVLHGELDLEAFQRAWQRVMDRHTILRSAFVWKQQDQPLQAVLRRVEVALEHHDWRGFSPAEQQSRLEAYLTADRRRGFEMSTAPLMRFALFRVANDTHQFVWTQHHILLDGWSWPIVKGEALRFYEAFRGGQNLEVAPARPYRDYLGWLMRQDLVAAEKFWRGELKGFQRPTALGVPDGRGGATETEDRYGVADARLPAATTAALSSAARQRHLTLNTVVQGAWALLLHRYSGSDDVVFGTTVSGRPSDLPGAEDMVGLFINTLPFRVTARPRASVSGWLQEVQERHLALRSYEYCSAGQVHQWSEMPGSSPLYESILVFQNYPSASSLPQSSLLTLEAAESRNMGARTNYAATILIGAGDGIFLRLVHDVRRIDPTGAQSMLRHFLSVLESIAAEPEQEIATLLRRIPSTQIPRVRALQSPEGRRSPETFVAPRTAIERMLVDVLEGALGNKRVGVRDNFFDVGGHSLLAVRLFAEIKKMTGRTLPLATLLQAPTVEQLAEVLRKEDWTPSWSSLVPIQAGGPLPPFYCIHAVGGNVLTYLDLSRHLGREQPVYGLQAKGLDGKVQPLGRVEDMAARYVREIRELQPEGPYYLGGSSGGGLVAFEIAQQLHAQGEQVGVLALFDTWGPDYPRYLPGGKPWRLKLTRFFQRVDLHVGNFLAAQGAREKLSYLATKSLRLRNRTRRWIAFIRRGYLDKFAHPLPRALRKVENMSKKALERYRARLYPGRVTLFRATKQPPGIWPDPELGWTRVAGRGVEVYEVPGYHGAIVYEPRIRILAEQLSRCLAKAREEFAGRGEPAERLSSRLDRAHAALRRAPSAEVVVSSRGGP